MSEQTNLNWEPRNNNEIIEHRIIDMRRRGFTYREIRKTLGISSGRVNDCLRRHGMQGEVKNSAQSSTSTRLHGAAKDRRTAEILKVYHENNGRLSYAEIGEIVGCTDRVIAKTLNEHGIRKRKPKANGAVPAANPPENKPLPPVLPNTKERTEIEMENQYFALAGVQHKADDIDRLQDEIAQLNQTVNILLSRELKSMADQTRKAVEPQPRRRWYKFW